MVAAEGSGDGHQLPWWVHGWAGTRLSGVTRGGLTRLWPVSADAAVQAKCVAVKGRMLVHLEMCRERVRTLNSEGWAGL